jgi:hypothetical protein
VLPVRGSLVKLTDSDQINDCVSGSGVDGRNELYHLVLLWTLLSASSTIVERFR